MSIMVHGPIAYDMNIAYGCSLTDNQADSLISGFAKLGMQYKKGIWKEKICVFTKAPADAFRSFKTRLDECWREVMYERTGIEIGRLSGHSNTSMPGFATFSPNSEWYEIEAFIEKNWNHPEPADWAQQVSKLEKKQRQEDERWKRKVERMARPWWKFWV